MLLKLTCHQSDSQLSDIMHVLLRLQQSATSEKWKSFKIEKCGKFRWVDVGNSWSLFLFLEEGGTG